MLESNTEKMEEAEVLDMLNSAEKPKLKRLFWKLEKIWTADQLRSMLLSQERTTIDNKEEAMEANNQEVMEANNQEATNNPNLNQALRIQPQFSLEI